MPDEKRIKDFEPATNLLIDDWIAVDSPSQGTRKIQKSMFMADEIASLQTLSTAMGNAQIDIGNLQTRAGMSQSLNFGDNLTDGVNILSVLLGAEPYVNTRTYAVGEYCIYEKQLYKCTTAVTSAEDFDSDKWTLTNVKTELTELNSSLTNIQSILPQVGTATASITINAGQHMNADVPITIPSGKSVRFVTVLYTPNGSYVLGQVVTVSNTRIVVGLYNTATSSVSGNITVQYLYY